VPDAAGGLRTLVKCPLHRRRRVWALCGRTRGGMGDEVSSRSAGSGMRGRLGWCDVQWFFRGFCADHRLGHIATATWGTGTSVTR
jgi:hypothetical protein